MVLRLDEKNMDKKIFFAAVMVMLISAGLLFVFDEKPNEKPSVRQIEYTVSAAASIEAKKEKESTGNKTETDETKIKETKAKETKEAKGSKEESEPIETVTEVFAGVINLNTATYEELMQVPDMDEATANGILELREKISYFSHVYELLYVDGITEKRLSGWEQFFKVE